MAKKIDENNAATEIKTRDKAIQVRVTDEEYKLIEQRADYLGISTSNYLRMVSIHCTIDISISADTVKTSIKKL
jgi:predicted DNA binding CopG/RHH family protein